MGMGSPGRAGRQRTSSVWLGAESTGLGARFCH